MTKILTGSTISYGTSLPSIQSVTDGTLFFLTTSYTDPAGSPSNPSASPIVREVGLQLFNFQQDVNPGAAGDQVGFGWRQLSTLDDFVKTTGDIMTGELEVPSLRIQHAAPGIRFTESDQALNQKEWLLVVDGTNFQLQTRTDAYGVIATPLVITRGGVLSTNGSTIWHAGNDGAASGLDADLLDGNHGSFYLSAANHTGTVPVSRGGTGITSVPSVGGVVYGASASTYGLSAVGTAGQVLLSGGAGAPTWANQSSLAGALSSSFVLKAGDTMTGNLTVPNFTSNGTAQIDRMAVGGISMPGSSGQANFNNTIQVFNGNIINSGGNITATSSSSRFIGGNSAYGGTMTNPMYSFAPWTGTGGASNGLYMPGANEVRLVVAGSDIMRWVSGQISVTGNFHATGNVTAFSVFIPSDRRLKENIRPIDSALSKVQRIIGVTYDRVDHLGPRQTGVIAQDVQAVLPEAVQEMENGKLSVAYGNMVGLLIEAIKEQQAQIDSLQNQIIGLTQHL